MAVARESVSARVFRPTPQLAASCRLLSPQAHFSRRMSLIFRMVTRSAGIGPSPIKWKAHDTQVEEDLRREWLRNDRTAARRPLFRGMPAADSERTRKSGRLPVGISGRVPSEWVADLRRNQWPAWVGIRSG